jgi:hypothetical protein
MKKAVKQLVEKGQDHVLGERTFAAITAVEGISLSAASRKRLASMKKRKLTNEQQRSEIVRAYTETKNR